MPQQTWEEFEGECLNRIAFVYPFSFGVPTVLNELGVLIPPLSGWATGLADKFTKWWIRWRDGFESAAEGETLSQSETADLLRSCGESAFAACVDEFEWEDEDLDAFFNTLPPFSLPPVGA